MGCCFSYPDFKHCKQCKVTVMESYPHTYCPNCNRLLATADKQPEPFAMPQLPRTGGGVPLILII